MDAPFQLLLWIGNGSQPALSQAKAGEEKKREEKKEEQRVVKSNGNGNGNANNGRRSGSTNLGRAHLDGQLHGSATTAWSLAFSESAEDLWNGV
ncbi:hypothetical protein CCMA1212_002350 [Trichoderma ghanense]|uniref:Uncharacterized protein n=1 Tax=Trichoderma ghanense TaxID=65468 RepID=A0ABY2HDX3_9HYPO